MKKKILIGLGVVLLVIQFFRIDKSQPEINAAEDFLVVNSADSEIVHLFKGACYDCHSNEVEYPWYTNVAPLSWWISGHIKNGRGNLNFSTFSSLEKGKASHKIEECIEEIESNHMPPKSYRFMHADAKWSDEEKEKVISWLKSL